MRRVKQLSHLAVFVLSLFHTTHSQVEFWGEHSVVVCLDESDSVTRAEADEFCDRHYGTKLASLDSEARFQAAKQLMNNTDDCTWDTWISLEWDLDEEAWLWESGEEACESDCFSHWDADQGYPIAVDSNDTDTEQLCVLMQHSFGLEWRNVRCDSRLRQLICEVPSSRVAYADYHSAVRLRDPLDQRQAMHFCRNHFGTSLGSYHSRIDSDSLRVTISDSDAWDNSVDSQFWWGLVSGHRGMNWTNMDDTRRDYPFWSSGHPYRSDTHVCSTVTFGPVSAAMQEKQSECTMPMNEFVCNNEILRWSEDERFVLVEAPLSAYPFTGVAFRLSLQNDWTFHQAQSYCFDRFGMDLATFVNVSDISGMVTATVNGSGHYSAMWLGLYFSESKDEFVWQNGRSLSSEFKSDELWMDGWEESLDLARNSDLICVYLEIEMKSDQSMTGNMNESVAQFGLSECDDQMSEFVCDSHVNHYLVYLRSVEVETANSHLKNSRHYLWAHAHQSGIDAYFNRREADLLCFLNFGTHLGSIHTNSSMRVVSRAGKSLDENPIGWIGLEMNPYKNWRWSDSPYTGFHVIQNRGSASNQNQMCTVTTRSSSKWNLRECWKTSFEFLCSSVHEKWSERVMDETEELDTIEQGYLRDLNHSKIGLLKPPRKLLPRFSLLRSSNGTELNHRDYERWCQHRYNMDGASVRSQAALQELLQLLRINNLLFSEKQGRQGLLVFLGAKYDAQRRKWLWYDESRVDWAMLTEAGVDRSRVKDKSKQCLAMDTSHNISWISVNCRTVKSSIWVCKTPRILRAKHHFRTPLRGKFCMVHWFYGLLTVVIASLSVLFRWFMIRMLQYDTFRECEDSEMIREVFHHSSDVNQNGGGLLDCLYFPRIHRLKSTNRNHHNSEQEQFDDYINGLLISNYDLPTDVCRVINQFTGAPLANAMIVVHYQSRRWLILFTKHFWIWMFPVMQVVMFVLSSSVLMCWYVVWAEDRHSDWQRYAGFWTLWLVHPGFVKMLTMGLDSTRIRSLYSQCHLIAKDSERPKGRWSTLMSLLSDFEWMIRAYCVAIWGCTAVLGCVVYPWLGVTVLIVLTYADAYYSHRNLIAILTDLAQWSRIDTSQLRKMHVSHLIGEWLKHIFHASVMCVGWLCMLVSGIGFWILITDRQWWLSHSDAWNNPYCDSYWDFDVYDWRAWILLIHWLFF